MKQQKQKQSMQAVPTEDRMEWSLTLAEFKIITTALARYAGFVVDQFQRAIEEPASEQRQEFEAGCVLELERIAQLQGHARMRVVCMRPAEKAKVEKL